METNPSSSIINTMNEPNHDYNTGPILSNESDILIDFPPIIRIFKDGRVERRIKIRWTPPTPTSSDNTTGVLSKDVVISSEINLLARIFIPKETVLNDCCKAADDDDKGKKLPLLVYIHGGAFCIESAFSSTYHDYVTSLVAEAKVVAISVNYRLTPEHLITDCFEDTWATILWAVAHHTGHGPEPWLTRHVDFNRVFFAGDSAGANIAVDMAWRIGQGQGEGAFRHPLRQDCCDVATATLVGIILIHPFFGWDDKPNAMWELYCPDTKGILDPRLNPIVHPDVLAETGCRRVLVCVAEKDGFGLCERGVSYYKALMNSGWDGAAELVETPGEGHVFHLFRPDKDKSRHLLKKVASFLNRQPA